ncbi:hypothetical protein NDU88_005962 [Pleurodeles waltl]|uniref:Uncharacterized protein n=1 Tax=Pleurodeles waltl TaxID=8319 RepID=A0AAV7QM81_PLEWA|nr:hypothetical protein NDU88_005962 [Pleurodeles waltl]
MLPGGRPICLTPSPDVLQLVGQRLCYPQPLQPPSASPASGCPSLPLRCLLQRRTCRRLLLLCSPCFVALEASGLFLVQPPAGTDTKLHPVTGSPPIAAAA